MKQRWKKITAFMLVIIMVLGMIPDTAVTVHAEEAVTQEQAAGSSTDGTSGMLEEEKMTESITEEATTEEATTEELTTEVGTTEQKTESEPDSLEGEKGAGKVEKTTEQTEDARSSDVQEPDMADTEQKEHQAEFRTVERYTLYCMQDTRVYELADTASAVLEELKAGDLFTVTAEADAWYRIAYGTEEETGYVEKKEGCFTRELEEEMIMPVAMEEEPAARQSAISKMIYSDGTWSGGIIWYVNDKDKHYIFCLNRGSTMYSGKYSGDITTGYSGYDAFRIATALNYFKSKNGGWGGKKDYGLVQQVIWNTGSSDLSTYIKHAWKLADNNSNRSPGSSSYDGKLKAVTGVTSESGRKKVAESLTAQKVTNTDGVISKTINLSGSAWKYFAKESFGSGISVMGVYDKDGKAVSYDKGANYVGSDGKLHIKIATDFSTGFGGKDNPATIIMKLKFPYQGADKFRYLLTPAGKQNLTYDASADTSAYFAIKVYVPDIDFETPKLSINKVDEFGSELSGCTFYVKGTSGDALTNKYENEQVINSTDDIFEIKYAGTYSIQETAVPANGEYELNTEVVTFTADWEQDSNGVNKLVLNPPLLLPPEQAGRWNWDAAQNRLTYTCTNNHTEGAAVLKKYGSMLVSWKDGRFVYEKKELSGAGFAFYADEDIYCGDKVVFEKGKRIYRGTLWGGISHQITINGNRAADFFDGTYETDADGKITISGLPAGDYYAVETDTPDGYENPDTKYYFTIVPNKTVRINGDDGNGEIINKVTPAACHVFKVDETANKALNGGEFTIYADVANTDFYGKPLFDSSDTVPAVTARNLATGEVTVEEGRWVPIQTVTTKEGGMAEFDDLPRGRYLVTETKAPVTEDGCSYELAEESYIFVHDGETNASANGFNFEHTFRDMLSEDYKIVKHVETAQKADDGRKDVYVFSDAPAAGAVFGIYAAEDIYSTVGKLAWKTGQQIAAVTTNEEGIAAYSGVLYSGKYFFKEIETPDASRYILDTTEYPFTVDADNSGGLLTEEPLINKLYKGSIKVIKTDGETKYPLEGVEFALYDHDKQKLNSFVTDEKGEIHIEELPVGTYYLQETKTGENYYLDDTLREVSISKEHLDQVVEVSNDRMKGSIKLIKTDGHKKIPLEGVEFDLLDSEKNVTGSYKTDENGEIFIDNLEIGTYYIQETKTLKGYKLTDELIQVELTPEELDKIVEVTNDRDDTYITIHPNTSIDGNGGVKTGDSGLTGFITGLFLLFMLAVAFYIKKKAASGSGDWKTAWTKKKKNTGIRPGCRPIPEWKAWFIKKQKPLLAFGIVVSGSILLSLSIKAAAGLKETASRELTNAEYNGKIYSYAVEKQFEVPDEDTDVTAGFEKEVNGMELQDISVRTFDTIPGTELKTLEETKDYKGLTKKDAAEIAKTLKVGSETYELSGITWSEEPNIEHVDYTVEYGYRTKEPEPAQTYEYTYTSPVTKKENTVTLPFVRLEKGSAAWKDGFSAVVTFHNLDGKYFTLGSHEFAYNKDSISFSEADYAELIRMLGYDAGKYRLTSARWQGKEYKDKDGISCRDAYVAGQQYASSYKAVYEDDVENGKLYTAHVVYTCEVETPSEEAPPTYVVQATGYYKKASVWRNIITFVTEHKAVSAVSAGIVILFIILAIVLLVTSRRRKKALEAGGRDA